MCKFSFISLCKCTTSNPFRKHTVKPPKFDGINRKPEPSQGIAFTQLLLFGAIIAILHCPHYFTGIPKWFLNNLIYFLSGELHETQKNVCFSILFCSLKIACRDGCKAVMVLLVSISSSFNQMTEVMFRRLLWKWWKGALLLEGNLKPLSTGSKSDLCQMGVESLPLQTVERWIGHRITHWLHIIFFTDFNMRVA